MAEFNDGTQNIVSAFIAPINSIEADSILADDVFYQSIEEIVITEIQSATVGKFGVLLSDTRWL